MNSIDKEDSIYFTSILKLFQFERLNYNITQNDVLKFMVLREFSNKDITSQKLQNFLYRDNIVEIINFIHKNKMKASSLKLNNLIIDIDTNEI